MDHFLEHPEDLPAPFLAAAADGVAGRVGAAVVGASDGAAGGAAGAGARSPELVRAVTDYVAGMTDRYAQRLYLELFMPRCWGNL